MEIYREVEQDEKVIDRIAATQHDELEQEIAILQVEAEAERVRRKRGNWRAKCRFEMVETGRLREQRSGGRFPT
jgi:hypothetical protein